MAPFAFLMILAIKLTSRGPALYGKHLVSPDGRDVIVVRFRTFCLTADGARPTLVGKLISRYRLDLIFGRRTVIRGEMRLGRPVQGQWRNATTASSHRGAHQAPAVRAPRRALGTRRLLLALRGPGVWRVSRRVAATLATLT